LLFFAAWEESAASAFVLKSTKALPLQWTWASSIMNGAIVFGCAITAKHKVDQQINPAKPLLDNISCCMVRLSLLVPWKAAWA
jgi:hypothetical protein